MADIGMGHPRRPALWFAELILVVAIIVIGGCTLFSRFAAHEQTYHSAGISRAWSGP